MTREEAIVFLKDMNECGILAVDMAIKALEQQPCEDAVSRQALKRKLQEHHDLFINAYGGRVGFKFMADDKEKARIDEINNCIAMVVNESSVTPKEKSEYEHDREVVKAYNDGQAFILDKVREEIEKESEVKTLQLHWGEAMGLNKAIDIIDKYRESEDKE